MPPIRPRTIALLIAGLLALAGGVKAALVVFSGPNLVVNVNTNVAKLVGTNRVQILKPLSTYTYVFTVDNPEKGKVIVLSIPSPYISSLAQNIMVIAVCDNGTQVGPKPLTDFTVIGPYEHCQIYVKTPIETVIVVRLV